MLCCRRKKDNRVMVGQRIIGESSGLGPKYLTHPGYQQAVYVESSNMPTLKRSVHFPNYMYSSDGLRVPEMVLQNDFRKVRGISSEIFRQIKAVEQEYVDPITLAHLESADKRGEMLVRILDPRTLGAAGAEIAKKYQLSSTDSSSSVQFVEIIKRPGQTLGLYIREGDGFRSCGGVFISRTAIESPIHTSGLLKINDEILAVNLVDVRDISLDDVVLIMSIPRRLVLTIRTHSGAYLMNDPMASRRLYQDEPRQPVVIVKNKFSDDNDGSGQDELLNRYPDNDFLMRARLKGLASVGTGREGIGSESPYSTYGRTRILPRNRAEEAFLAGRSKGYSMLTSSSSYQPLIYPSRLNRTSDSLSQIYSNYSSSAESPYSSLKRGGLGSGLSMARTLLDSPARLRFLNEYGTLTRQFNRLSRTESDNCLYPLTRDYGKSFIDRPRSRGTLRSLSGDYGHHHHSLLPQHKRIGDLRSTIGGHSLSSGYSGRRTISDGSASDSEVGGSRGHTSYHKIRHRDWQRGEGRSVSTSEAIYSARNGSLTHSGSGLIAESDKLSVTRGSVSGESGKEENFNGILWINIIAGRGLRSSSTNVPTTNRDLYCVIECDRVHKARTVVRSGDSSFDWDEIFELDLVETRIVSLLLYSWDPQYRHKLCYKGSIKLYNLTLKDPTVHSLSLKMEPKGTLYIKLRYKDISVSFQRIPCQPSSAIPNPLFGVDLESVVNRENSGLNIPLVVKKCTLEVEERGVNLVGIYRLCASAVRKKILREAFEKDSSIVDLSAEHVPDINVITSLLKDFIRELPEPLFTKALFEMMVDGLGVCLPDDGPGKAKLMFSIFECLPKINRATVLYLMDHIKFVESHNKRNKMNAQALAMAFGPIFTCHSDSNSLQKPIEVFKTLLEVWPLKDPKTERNLPDTIK